MKVTSTELLKQHNQSIRQLRADLNQYHKNLTGVYDAANDLIGAVNALSDMMFHLLRTRYEELVIRGGSNEELLDVLVHMYGCDRDSTRGILRGIVDNMSASDGRAFVDYCETIGVYLDDDASRGDV